MATIGGLKQIFTQVVEARKSAQAALEGARGETATLRSLANAARLLEGNLALVTLKTLQAASTHSSWASCSPSFPSREGESFRRRRRTCRRRSHLRPNPPSQRTSEGARHNPWFSPPTRLGIRAVYGCVTL